MVLAVLLVVCLPASAQQQRRKTISRRKPSSRAAAPVATYRSRNFVLHTDLSKKEAQQLLAKLEKMISLISRYWGRRNPHPIECYIVQDLQKWPDGVLRNMDPNGLAKIRSRSGVTVSQVLRSGLRFRGKATVYSVAEKNIPLHEAVHAYCIHAFGETGPVWYSEGMAEMGKYWRDKDPAVHCSEYVARYLRESPPKPLAQIVDPNQRTGDSWQNYAWRWALCHLLANNTNYAARFRPLGIGLLTGNRRASFAAVYGSMAKEIEFEYHLFLQHLQPGYRVDLCSWDWKTRYKQPLGGNILNCRIAADRGWQASRLLVRKGQTYEFRAEGTWKIDNNGTDLTADGLPDGKGRLVGVVFSDYQLSGPFALGRYGTFTAPADGQLLLRCRDDWGKIADNKGTLAVKLKVAGKGKPLPEPAASPRASRSSAGTGKK